MNGFLQAVKRYDTYTENGAVSHGTSGAALVDYFAKAGTYAKRSYDEVAADVSRCWAESPKVTLQIVFWLRMVTRPAKGFGLGGPVNNPVQKGQGVRHEFRHALRWLAEAQPDALRANLHLVPTVGTWKDLWHGQVLEFLPRDEVYALIERGLEDSFHAPLLAKYLPQLRSAGKRHTPRHEALDRFARGLCARLGWTARDYRRFKAQGSAHGFQRDMCAGRWDALDWKTIPGRALFTLVGSRGRDGKTTIERHGQDARYVEWIAAQPVVPFTGYVHELFQAATKSKRGGHDYRMANLSVAQRMTYDRQFDGLIALAQRDSKKDRKKDRKSGAQPGLGGNVWCALDTSGSMYGLPFEVCVSLGIYFSTLNEGAFKDHVVMFDNTSRVLKLAGTFTDKARQIATTATAWGSTEFQSVIDEIVRVRQQNPSIPVADFPRTLIVVSDMQFNPTGDARTNYEAAMAKLAAVKLPRLRVVWWWVTGRGADFPSTIEDEGVTMIGGFDGSILTLLLGGDSRVVDAKTGKTRERNAFENMLAALDQDVLRALRLV